MATAMMRDAPTSMVYADGERLAINWAGQVLVVANPIVRQISWDMDVYERTFATCDGRRHFMHDARPRVTLDIVADGWGQHDGSVPDLRSIAERLTVGELFAVINRKLDGREV